MVLISNYDYDISFNDWNDAIVYHKPTKTKFIGCGQKEKWQNLYTAFEAMRKIIMVK